MKREYYSDSIPRFCSTTSAAIIGSLSTASATEGFPVTPEQTGAWVEQISILQKCLNGKQGKIYFEYSIPRMGRRIDVVLIIERVIFVLEFKVGAQDFSAYAVDQVLDYALDLSNFHETSHGKYVAPVLVSTQAQPQPVNIGFSANNSKLCFPIKCASSQIEDVISKALSFTDGPSIAAETWEGGRYSPTPTIVEAAMALYRGHKVAEISRSDAGAINLAQTSASVAQIISAARAGSRKAICFVTGVPGAGKTLVGLNIATTHINKDDELYSVFLSGNGPLVAVLREALARDRVLHEKAKGNKVRKGAAFSEVKMFVQNVHNFRDSCLIDAKPPIEHVALFDEAQRAWDLQQTANFMSRKKKIKGFNQSEPEFLISCLDRHPDWAVIVCLVGGGQEINTGEAGISEWIDSLLRKFPGWDVHISPRLTDSEYGAGSIITKLNETSLKVEYKDELHLAVSLRSFRAERVSELVKKVLDLEAASAKETLKAIGTNYPIVLTRDLKKAKDWLKARAQGTERYGIVVSSQAERLKPYAIDVKSPVDPVDWFLAGKDDVRSSYYLEDVATEFHVQGLELDWACVTWDADMRHTPNGWENWSFKGNKWLRILKDVRKDYQKNAYRVLLTRARQGMVIVVPQGDPDDHTRAPGYYDSTYQYLSGIGFQQI
ncbi:MAG: DUF2075 domain-containing protein [Elusimicrobiota bacterium]|nr:DUF2075 domain-containing protein [Elusimicrobiota bacterium]